MDHLVGALILSTIGAVVIVWSIFFFRHDRRSKGGAASPAPAKGGPSTTLACGDATSKPAEQPEKATG